MAIPMALLTVTQFLAAHGEARSIAGRATARTVYDDYADELVSEVRRRADGGDEESRAALATLPGTPEWQAAKDLREAEEEAELRAQRDAAAVATAIARSTEESEMREWWRAHLGLDSEATADDIESGRLVALGRQPSA